VAYAQKRYITIIPEIEMPGHSVAALAAYPELACTEGPFEVSTIWGVKPDIYCPKEETFAFLEDVLTEVMELFPGTYIHIGGDEAPKLRWEESEFAQQVIQREGLQDEHELQSYFIRRIEEFLLANGRRLIGWDEILEGGLAPQATVMSWRGTQGGIDAAQQGHDVIMTPTSHMYFDYYQAERQLEPLAIGGYLPLEKVYAFEPIPEVLNEEEAKHILGAQGNVWTEYMKTTAYVEYMVFPRLLALSEVVWSPAAIRDWDRFVGNLNAQLEILDAYRINYRVPHVTGLETDVLTLEDEATVTLSTLIPEAEIRYTTDGSDPGYGSELYTRPFRLPVNTTGVVVMARAILPNGRQSGARSARFYQTRLQPAVELAFGDLSPGLRYAYYEAQVRSVRQLPDHEPVGAGVMTGIGLEAAQRDADFGLEISGFIRVPESDIYTFHLLSDDGSELRIGSTVVVDHDGYHGATERQGTIALAAGYHPITVRYFQAGGAQALRLSVTIAGKQRQAVDERWLFHRK
jgi:hexosaminidase